MSARRTETIELPVVAPGNRRRITVHRYGSGRPKVYLHAALHADEWPGLLVLQHLLMRLDQAAAAGLISGEIVVVPVANPIGLGQFLNGSVSGRYDFDVTGNFNRDMPALGERLIGPLADRLGDDPAANADLIRVLLRRALAELTPRREAEALKAMLLAQAIDADYVFDLHCDHEALLHVYAPRDQRDIAEQLSTELDAAVLLLEDDPGGGAFDQAASSPWRVLRERYGERVPRACFACTVELRGQCDIDEALAAHDAAALYRFLQRRGVMTGKPVESPEHQGISVPLEGVDVLRAPAPGLVIYRRMLGELVTAGETIADLVDLEAVGQRTPIRAGTDGVLFARVRDRLVRPGQGIAKIAGSTPLDYRKSGTLLVD